MLRYKRILLLTLGVLSCSAYSASYVPGSDADDFLGADATRFTNPPSTPESAHEQLRAVSLERVPVERFEAWNRNVHSIIMDVFGTHPYPKQLKSLVNAASFLIEQMMKKPFESDLDENQERTRTQLAPALLACQSLEEQAHVLMRMVDAHKRLIPNSEDT